ncbi:3017_t:CDS:2 [Dentiscutata heterogama]|uniref:3017_t:CDS:1 n=1 Tax=Dentiscutata heterogama TaxID=1316150 RepID=A0ACA9K4X6_9GLOM|nr:3017_t:CDS:2 [Dentiscutata heterogama]
MAFTFVVDYANFVDSLNENDVKILIDLLNKRMKKSPPTPPLSTNDHVITRSSSLPSYISPSSFFNNTIIDTPPSSPSLSSTSYFSLENTTFIRTPPVLKTDIIKISEYYQNRNLLDSNINLNHLLKKTNDLVINQGFMTTTWDSHKPCFMCWRSYPHTCCSSCKRLSGPNLHLCNGYEDFCRCQYSCGLVYPAQYSPDDEVSSWKKCKFYVDRGIDLESALAEHIKTCKGTIKKDLSVVCLKVSKHKTKKGTRTDPIFINLNKDRCELCKEIHDIRQACHGENLECWSSNTTLVDLPLTMLNHANETAKFHVVLNVITNMPPRKNSKGQECHIIPSFLSESSLNELLSKSFSNNPTVISRKKKVTEDQISHYILTYGQELHSTIPVLDP